MSRRVIRYASYNEWLLDVRLDKQLVQMRKSKVETYTFAVPRELRHIGTMCVLYRDGRVLTSSGAEIFSVPIPAF